MQTSHQDVADGMVFLDLSRCGRREKHWTTGRPNYVVENVGFNAQTGRYRPVPLAFMRCAPMTRGLVAQFEPNSYAGMVRGEAGPSLLFGSQRALEDAGCYVIVSLAAIEDFLERMEV